MDEHKTISIHRVYVPDEYTIFLNPADREQFAAYETQMRNELAEYLVEHARREGYSLPARPLVLIETETSWWWGRSASPSRPRRRPARQRPHIGAPARPTPPVLHRWPRRSRPRAAAAPRASSRPRPPQR